MKGLHRSQEAALQHVRGRAGRTRDHDRRLAASLLSKAAGLMAAFDALLAALRDRPAIDLNFHPDRLDRDGRSVALGLLNTGTYRNQFETGISNGGLTAFPGGDRDRWEQRMFGGAYQGPDVLAPDRPKYGGLNLFGYWDGACPRFGCCYLRLKPAAAARCTFSYGDSSTDPRYAGTVDSLDAVLAAAVVDVAQTGRSLGREWRDAASFLEAAIERISRPPDASFSDLPGRCLDETIEVQVHGSVALGTDVAALVADQVFLGTETGDVLEAVAQKYGFPLLWHPGLTLLTDKVPADFRGPAMVPLARAVACDGVLDAARIGRATVSLHREPDRWVEWGTPAETLQSLKQLWHVLAAFGEPGRA